MREDPHTIDALWQTYLQTEDETEAECILGEFIARHAEPLVKRYLRSKLHAAVESQVVEELWGALLLSLLPRLRTCRTSRDEKAISQIGGYIVSAAYREYANYLHRKSPMWHQLKDELLRFLVQHIDFAYWRNGENDLCGLAAWRDQPEALARTDRYYQMLNDLQAFEDAALPNKDVQHLGYPDLLDTIFKWVGNPIKFNDLVSVVFRLKRIEEPILVFENDTEELCRVIENLPAPEPLPDVQAWVCERLQRLWAEIETLLPRQRLAYLLNFRAEDYGVEIFMEYGVATIQHIGKTLQLSDEQFAQLWQELPLDEEERQIAKTSASYDEQFAMLWNFLPIEDAIIAKLLSTKRQKVINLRIAARKRLVRRLQK